MKHLLPVLILLCCSTSLFGQLRKVIHATFDTEQSTSINFDIYDEYEVQLWAGDNIMIETTVKLYEGSAGILKFFIEQGRYEIEGKLEGEVLAMVSKDKERRPIKTKNGECFEQVNHKIFLPDNFVQNDDNNWLREVDAPDKITKDN